MARPFHKIFGFKALQIMTLLTHISCVLWTILKCKVSTFNLKIDKCTYELRNSQCFTVLFPCLFKGGGDTFLRYSVSWLGEAFLL